MLTSLTRNLFYYFTKSYERWALDVNENEIKAILRIASWLTGKDDIPMETVSISTVVHFVPAENSTDKLFRRVNGRFDVRLASMDLVSDICDELNFVQEPEAIHLEEEDAHLFHECVMWFEQEIFGIESFTGLSSLIWRIDNEHQATVLFGSAPYQPKPEVQGHEWGERSSSQTGSVRKLVDR